MVGAFGALMASWAMAGWPVASTAAVAGSSAATAQVSFDASAEVRLRGQRFTARSGSDAGAVNDLLGGHAGARVERLFSASETSIDAARGRLVAAGKRAVPDLNRHYRIVVAGGAAERDRLLDGLRALAVVDSAMPEPQAPPPPAGDYTGQQGYRTAAPVGINAPGVVALAGGQGENTKIIDIEFAWNRGHEDLAKAAPVLIPNGTPVDPFSSTDHGTAVLGMLIGTVNGFGVSGIATGSEIGVVNAESTAGYTLPNAVDVARRNLQPGDVMLVEQQFPVTPSGTDYVASEYWPPVYDAIRLATQAGIIVVEAAGNGNVDLDLMPRPFPSGMPDSGAIIVGAGTGTNCNGLPANTRTAISSYGDRVDLQGWGQCVTSTGYGSLFNGGPNALYTASFSGTSSASALVASAAAVYSSVVQAAAAGRAPSPQAVRSRLIATGTPQSTSVAGHIGPLPNLLAATTNLDVTPPTVSFAAGPAGSTPDATPTFEFTVSEAGSTTQCRVGADAFTPCNSPYTTATLADGVRTVEIRATDAALNTGPGATRTFTVDTGAPVISISEGPSGSTVDVTPTFSFSSDDAAATFECRVGTQAQPGAFAACASPHTPSALAVGAYVFEVPATDAAGNSSAPASRAFTVEDVAGAAPPPLPTTGSSTTNPPGVTPPAPGLVLAEPPSIGGAARLTVAVGSDGRVRLASNRIGCPATASACVATATAHRSWSANATSRSVIGRATLTIGLAKSATISFALNRAARAALKRDRVMKVTVRLTAGHGAQVATRTLRLKLVRRR